MTRGRRPTPGLDLEMRNARYMESREADAQIKAGHRKGLHDRRQGPQDSPLQGDQFRLFRPRPDRTKSIPLDNPALGVTGRAWMLCSLGSMVLLKNDGDLLPLQQWTSLKTIAVIRTECAVASDGGRRAPGSAVLGRNRSRWRKKLVGSRADSGYAIVNIVR